MPSRVGTIQKYALGGNRSRVRTVAEDRKDN